MNHNKQDILKHSNLARIGHGIGGGLQPWNQEILVNERDGEKKKSPAPVTEHTTSTTDSRRMLK